MDTLFLDANVLFSAAYRADSGLRRFWELEGVRLITSAYAAHEARRNLDDPEQRRRLDQLVERMSVVPEAPDAPLPANVDLPTKDLPILRAAIGAGASHLVTGDRTHFGPLFEMEVAGVRVVRPAPWLRKHSGS